MLMTHDTKPRGYEPGLSVVKVCMVSTNPVIKSSCKIVIRDALKRLFTVFNNDIHNECISDR